MKPIPWAASRLSGKFHYDIRAQDKNFAKLFIKTLYRESPIIGFVVLNFEFHFSYPPSSSKKKKEEMRLGNILPVNCDLTNLQKLYEDCLKGIVITDDRNVCKIISKKIYAEKEGILIEVWPLSEYQQQNGSSF